MNKRKKKKKNKKKKRKNDKNVKASHVQTFHVVRFDFDDFEVTLNSDSNDSHVYFYNIYIDKKAAQKIVAVVTINSVEND